MTRLGRIPEVGDEITLPTSRHRPHRPGASDATGAYSSSKR